MFDWISNNEVILWWILFFSIASFMSALILVPIILILIPEDYFSTEDRHRDPWSEHHPLIRIPLIIVKNLIGIIFVVTGTLMVALPGQGILTIIAGVILLDFPGKYNLERKIIRKKIVLHTINWIRAKASKPSLIIDPEK
jgi:hypothetical protein